MNLESELSAVFSFVLSALVGIGASAEYAAAMASPEDLRGMTPNQASFGAQLSSSRKLLGHVEQHLRDFPKSELLTGAKAALERHIEELHRRGPEPEPDPGAPTKSPGVVIQLFPF